MIVVDTDVISELMRAKPDDTVTRWINDQEPRGLFATAITAAELLSGVELQPSGEGRDILAQRTRFMLEQVFKGCILPFDESCAPHFARIFAHRRAIGKRLEEPDVMIAATCARNGCKIATRNVRDFTDCGIEVINPWTD